MEQQQHLSKYAAKKAARRGETLEDKQRRLLGAGGDEERVDREKPVDRKKRAEREKPVDRERLMANLVSFRARKALQEERMKEAIDKIERLGKYVAEMKARVDKTDAAIKRMEGRL